MRRSFAFLFSTLVLAGFAQGQTASDLNEGTRLTHDSVNDTWSFSWWGRTGRTYFIQQSDDLMSWQYIPIIEPGQEDVVEWGFATNADRLFMRLKYTDVPTLDPWGDDFDGDNIGNWDELLQESDPFATLDLNGNGIPDDWELFWDSEIAVFPTPLELVLDWGEQTAESLYLNNPTASAANYSIAVTGDTVAGFSWEDSLTGTIGYNWTDISSTGTLMTTISDVDNDSQLITLSLFTFPFYGRDHTEVWVSTNGYLNFRQEYNDSTNDNLPDYSSPYGAIAPFWDDLDTGVGGEIYYKEEASRLIVQYEGVAKDDGSGLNTFQIVLNANGTVEFHYKEMNGDLDECSVGIQNVFRNQGIQLRFDSDVPNDPSNLINLQDSYAIRFNPTKTLYTLAPLSGGAPAGAPTEIVASFDTANVLPGTYTGSIAFTHDGTGTSPWNVPVEVRLPYAKITEPNAGYTLWEGETLSSTGAYLRAKVIDTPDDIDYVEFRFGDSVIGTDSFASNDEYNSNWPNVPAGEHQVYARVVLDNGQTNDSAPVLIDVTPDADGDRMDDRWEKQYFRGLQEGPLEDHDGDGASNLHEYEAGTNPDDDTDTPVNIPSTVVITDPVDGFSVLEGDSIYLRATVADSDFGVEYVDFLSNGAVVETDTSVSTVATDTWYNAPAGTHVLTAHATDRYGALSTSGSIAITVLPDADGDRMADDWEAQIVDFDEGDAFTAKEDVEASADFDGDGFPNIFEYHHGTDPTDPQDFPVFSVTQNTVSPVSEIGQVNYFKVYSGAPNSGYEWDSIQGALNVADNVGEGFDIIEVLPGTYNEDIQLSERVYLFSRDGARSTIIDGTGRNDSVIDLFSESVIDGFTIQNGGSTTSVSDGAGMYVSVGGNWNKPRVIGCLFVNNNANDQGGAIYVSSGDLTLVSCTLVNNQALYGRAIYSASNNNDIAVINSLLWNPQWSFEEIGGLTAGVVLSGSIVRDDATGNVLIDGLDQGTSDIGLTPWFGIYADSPARDAGVASPIAALDMDGELAVDGLPDIGADEFVDADADGMADSWEAFYEVTDPNANADTDALTNLQEYQNRTNPLLEDTDGDSISDSDEVTITLTDPTVPDLFAADGDSNNDGLDDGIGVQIGVGIGQTDSDGDGVSNDDERSLGTNPFAADTDGDGESDATDPFPLDPSLDSSDFGNNPGDSIAPAFLLTKPVEAIEI